MPSPLIIRIDADTAAGQAKIAAFVKSYQKDMDTAGKSSGAAAKGMDSLGNSVDGLVKKFVGLAAGYLSLQALKGIITDIVVEGAKLETAVVM